MILPTPYYLIYERKLLENLKTIEYVRNNSGIKCVLALKCFSTWSVFPLMKKYIDGTTSSSLYEARLGKEKFGGEVHAYSVAFSKDEVRKIKQYSNKIIFNSISQLERYRRDVGSLKIGLRINPQISFSPFYLADPAREFSRLGVVDKKSLLEVTSLISGLMFHFNCENDNFNNFSLSLDFISNVYAKVLKKMEWVSLGGGICFTKKGYPVKKFTKLLKDFSDRFGVQVYLEPGEAAITQSAELVTRVVDIVYNEIDIAIVDSSTEAHMLDLLVYRTSAKIDKSGQGKFEYTIAGRSCLAGDVFGIYRFKSRLKVGSIIRISDAAGYTMVKKNWFNGLKMPSIVVKRKNGSVRVIRRFGYKDFLTSLS